MEPPDTQPFNIFHPLPVPAPAPAPAPVLAPAPLPQHRPRAQPPQPRIGELLTFFTEQEDQVSALQQIPDEELKEEEEEEEETLRGPIWAAIFEREGSCLRITNLGYNKAYLLL